MCVTQRQEAIHRSKLRHGPFKMSIHPQDYFQKNPYRSDKPLPPAHRPLPPKEKVSVIPFKPPSPSKQVTLFGCSSSFILTDMILLVWYVHLTVCLFHFVLDWRNECGNIRYLSLSLCWSICNPSIQTAKTRAYLPSCSWSKKHSCQEHPSCQCSQVWSAPIQYGFESARITSLYDFHSLSQHFKSILLFRTTGWSSFDLIVLSNVCI